MLCYVITAYLHMCEPPLIHTPARAGTDVLFSFAAAQLCEYYLGIMSPGKTTYNWPRTVNMMDSNAASSGNFQDVLADVGMGNRELINAKQAPVPRRSAAPHSPYPAALRRGASRPRAAVHVSRRGSISIRS